MRHGSIMYINVEKLLKKVMANLQISLPKHCMRWLQYKKVFIRILHFYAPGLNDRGILFLSCLFVYLSVCLSDSLSVVNFNLCYNFWTIRDRDFIFGMHTPLMMPCHDTKVNDLVTLTLTLKLK